MTRVSCSCCVVGVCVRGSLCTSLLFSWQHQNSPCKIAMLSSAAKKQKKKELKRYEKFSKISGRSSVRKRRSRVAKTPGDLSEAIERGAVVPAFFFAPHIRQLFAHPLRKPKRGHLGEGSKKERVWDILARCLPIEDVPRRARRPHTPSI